MYSLNSSPSLATKTRMRSSQTLALPFMFKSSSEVLTSFIFKVTSCVGAYDTSSAASSNDKLSPPSASPPSCQLNATKGNSATARNMTNAGLDFISSPLHTKQESAVTLRVEGAPDSVQRHGREAAGRLSHQPAVTVTRP